MVIFLYLFHTVVVLRGTMGDDKFGTLEQDFERKKILWNPATMKPLKLMVNEGGNDEKCDPNTPYNRDPMISDWNEQHANWLINNLDCWNFIGPSKPRLLLVNTQALRESGAGSLSVEVN